MSEHFCLPLQVNLCIDVSCIDGDMTEPGPDRVDIDSGAKKVSWFRLVDSATRPSDWQSVLRAHRTLEE